jgi:hypothetical protein
MNRDQRRRQRTFAKKRAKYEATKLARKKSDPFMVPGVAVLLAARSAVHESLVPKKLFDLGIGNVIFSRRMSDGHIGMGVFLLDVFCLGVKDAFFAMVEEFKYISKVKQIATEEDLETVHPSCVRKLVQGAVAYAEQFGLKPHRDYRMAKRIFGDVDPAVCPQNFQYGHEGKPFYVSGPNDSPARSRQILARLEKHCGLDGFDFLIGMHPLE